MSSYDELVTYVKQLERRLAKLERIEGGGGGVTDHGALTGLGDDDHTQYLLASAATSRAAFGTNWTDLTDAGATTLHRHDHGGQDGLTDDDHAQYALLAGRSGGQSLVGGAAANDDLTLEGTSNATRTSSYIVMQPTAGNVGIGNAAPSEKLSVTGAISATGDVKPLGVAYGIGTRLLHGGITPDIHFSSATIPSGYAWAGSPFDGTPSALIYNGLSDYLYAVANTSGGRVFMYRPITNAAANWQGKSLHGRFGTGVTTEIGLRVDDGTDNNYAEIYTTGALANGMQRLDFRYRTGGGAVTTVNSAVIVPCSQYLTLQLFSYHNAGAYSLNGYLIGEVGDPTNITNFTMTSTSFSPSAGRAGIIIKQNNGNYAHCDWLRSEFV